MLVSSRTIPLFLLGFMELLVFEFGFRFVMNGMLALYVRFVSIGNRFC